MVPTFPTRAWTGSKLISSYLSEGLSNHTILLFEKTRYFGVLSLMLVVYSTYFVTVLSIFNPFPLDPPCSQSVSNRYSTTLFNPPLDPFKLYSSLLVINREHDQSEWGKNYMRDLNDLTSAQMTERTRWLYVTAILARTVILLLGHKRRWHQQQIHQRLVSFTIFLN